MGRYLIAGAAGYVGSRLAQRLLAEGNSVRGLVRDRDSEVVQQLAAQGMSVWEGDLTEPESLIGVAGGIEYVFNLTARSVLSNGHVRELFVAGNRNLIAACSRSRSVRGYVFTSNVAPYGDSGEQWVSEDSSVAPCYPLGETMVAAEQVIMELIRQHHFPAMILRLGSIYGPERDPVEAMISGTATLIGDGRNFTSRIHIDDLLTVLARVAVDGQPGAVYNVGDDQPLRALDVASMICDALGEFPPRPFPKASALAAGIDASVVGMASSSVRLSNRRITEELGISLRFPRFEDWLEERVAAETAGTLAVK
ncbi:MAG TPA: NAD-dependent epimerase/dehydratase family protein [Roseiflexaceae bacterium]|nr:NAD-dependent epimerase/dehydratase family protein [Roseiflexaceae bacterium]